MKSTCSELRTTPFSTLCIAKGHWQRRCRLYTTCRRERSVEARLRSLRLLCGVILVEELVMGVVMWGRQAHVKLIGYLILMNYGECGI